MRKNNRIRYISKPIDIPDDLKRQFYDYLCENISIVNRIKSFIRSYFFNFLCGLFFKSAMIKWFFLVK